MRARISSLFKKEMQITYTDYVNRKRVEYAKQLLTASNLQVQAVAQRCGILDSVTPVKYREMNR